MFAPTPMIVIPAFLLGFTLGVRHATDADHIAAISTIVADGNTPRRAALLGATWGLGHSASVLLVGGMLIILRVPMPSRLALALELLVALMLLALGARALLSRRSSSPPSAVRPLVVGLIHGMAGSAVLALLIIGGTAGAAGPIPAVIYLLLFCVGTIAGMSVITTLLAMPARLRPGSAGSIDRYMRLAAGIVSVAIGLSMVHRIGATEGLFGATPAVVVE